MTTPLVEPHEWPRRRGLAILALIMAGQLSMIWWLARQKTAISPPRAAAPSVILPADSRTGVAEAGNPAMFVLANRSGFSGRAWLDVESPRYDPPDWIDRSPAALPLAAEKLGGALQDFARTNQAALEPVSKFESEPAFIAPFEGPAAAQSTVSVEGELAARKLLRPLKPGDWPADGILSNSVVQAGVDQDGSVFSAVLLSKSGSKEADASALTLARAARFEPLLGDGTAEADATVTRLHWGRLVFHWHTVAPPATNSAPAGPVR